MLQKGHKITKRLLALMVSLTVMLSMAGFVMPVSADEPQAVTGGQTITSGGVYQIQAESTGVITVDTTDPVTLVGLGTEDTGKFNGLSVNVVKAGSTLTIRDLFIGKKSASEPMFNFTGQGNKFYYDGVSILDNDTNATGYAALHIGKDSELTIGGADPDDNLYIYKNEQGAGIGGNGGEANGKLVFTQGNLFIKGSKQGAVIGSGANSASASPDPIYINGGTINLIGNARGAGIGGSAGSEGAGAGTTVYMNAGLLNINVDWTGAGIGGGGYSGGNDSDGGTLIYTAGSVRVFIDTNAKGQWKVEEAGVHGNKAVTAAVKDADDNELALLELDTSLLPAADSYTVKEGGSVLYSGPRHKYSYVNENTEKDGQTPITSTPTNWRDTLNDPNLYLYATKEDHTYNVNGKTVEAAWDAEASSFVLTAESGFDPDCNLDPNAEEYLISNAAQLAKVAETVNGGNSLEGKTVSLVKDIDLTTNANWTPIGTASAPFAGTFDGAGKTISNLHITDATGGYKGLIGNNAGTVKDFTVTGNIGTADSYITTGADNLGGAVGYNDGTVSGVTGEVAVFVRSGIYAVGGIVGQNGDEALVSSCWNKANINASKASGGVVGRNFGEITLCKNSGDVTGNQGGKDGIGGIAGYGGDKNITYANAITYSYNTGTISNNNGRWHGGIVGFADSATTVTNCYDIGQITTGYSWNWNPIIGHVDGAYTTVHDNYSLEGLNAGDTDTATKPLTIGTVKTADEMKTPAFADDLGKGFKSSCGNYPVLSWEEAVEHTVSDPQPFNTDPTYDKAGEKGTEGTCRTCNNVVRTVTETTPSLKDQAEAAAEAAEEAKTAADTSKAAADKAAKTPGQAAIDAAKKAEADAKAAAEAAAAAKEAADRAAEAAETEGSPEAEAAAQKATEAATAKEAADSAYAAAKEATAKAEADKAAADKAAADKAAADKVKAVKTVTVNVKTVNAKAVVNAIKKAGGSAEYVTKIVLGKKVKKISASAFKSAKKVTELEVRTTKLKKKSVKKSLKASAVKRIKVKVSNKAKTNKKYVKKYKKIFTKKNAGKKVTVKR